MNPTLAHLLVRIYPRPWRERYGTEFELFLQSDQGGLHAAANVFWSALYERIFAAREGEIVQDSSSFRSWCIRAPWAIFGLIPIFVLAMAYFVACLYLWCGWTLFLSGADTPFGHRGGPIYGVQNIYFQAGKFFYFAAPVLVGWAVALTVARQRLRVAWPCVGVVLIAWMGSAARIYASRTVVHGSLGNVGMDFARAFSMRGVYANLPHGSVILSLSVLPYLIWRLRAASRLSA
jgi:hypothetical protein